MEKVSIEVISQSKNKLETKYSDAIVSEIVSINVRSL